MGSSPSHCALRKPAPVFVHVETMSAIPDYAFAAPYRTIRTSPIRAVTKFASQPGMISFAGGYPAPELFDREGLLAAAEDLQPRLVDYLQYTATEGQTSLRTELAALSLTRGITANPITQIMVTGGSQQSMSLLTRVMLDPGDNVIVERPAYPTTLQAVRQAGANMHTVATGPNGPDLDEMEELIQRVKPKLICLVTTFSNPSGASLTLAQRRRLLDMAVRYRVLVIEDDPYSALRFSGDPQPPLAALAQGEEANWTVYISSLSKTIAPGLRLGWMVAPEEILRRCISAKQADDLAVSPWIQEIAARYLKSGRYDEHLPRIVAAYAARCEAMSTSLTREFGSRLEFRAPDGGMFFWARLADGTDAADLLPHAVEQQVVFVPGAGFYADQTDPATMRLSFAMISVDEVVEGVARMARALAALDAQRRSSPAEKAA